MRLLYFLLLPILATSQSGPAKGHSNVWAAAIVQDWLIDLPLGKMETDSGVSTLKLLYDDTQKRYMPGHSLEELVLWAAAAEKFAYFKDAGCTVPMTWMEVLGYPVPTVDPLTGEEKMTIGCTDFNVTGVVKAWRLQQTVTCNTRTGTWETTVQAIAPLVENRNDDGDSIGLKPLFWFSPVDTRPKISSGHIVWAKKTVNRQEKTLVPLRAFRSHPSVEPEAALRDHFRHLLENRMDVPLFDAGNAALLGPEVRRTLVHQADTATNCFPTEEDTVSIIIFNFNRMDDVHHLELRQTWYWDTRKSRLHICLDAVAPLRDVFDNAGDLQSRRPLFFRRINK